MFFIKGKEDEKGVEIDIWYIYDLSFLFSLLGLNSNANTGTSLRPDVTTMTLPVGEREKQACWSESGVSASVCTDVGVSCLTDLGCGAEGGDGQKEPLVPRSCPLLWGRPGLPDTGTE